MEKYNKFCLLQNYFRNIFFLSKEVSFGIRALLEAPPLIHSEHSTIG